MNRLSGKVAQHTIVVALIVLFDLTTFSPPVLAQVAQVGRTEIRALSSATLTDQQFLTGQHGAPVMLAGELRLPRPGTERLPAVLLVHGSAGVVDYIGDWARLLNDSGVATFVLDAFSGRGLVNISDDQGKLGWLNMIVDSYRALELLSGHARIDPQRIAIMGFSRGGTAALYASVKRFQRMHLAQGLGFAAYIAFYPSCNVTYIGGDDVADKPIRIFHGSLDDFDPPGPCHPYVARLQKAGHDVERTEYPGAYHAFDSPGLKVPIQFPRSQTVRNCDLQEVEDGRIINNATKQTFTYEDPCVERGPTLGYSEPATRLAQSAVKAFLATTLKLQ